MPKSKVQKYYAVIIGRNGPRIYDSWDECKEKVSRYPGAVHKSFKSKLEAENWLGVQAKLLPQPPAPIIVDTNTAAPPPANRSAPALPGKTAVQLSPEQRKVFNAVQGGRNVFFTGSAGTGKSVLLREIIDFCGGKDSHKVAITATTGIAAINIGGCTLHSWAGIGTGLDNTSGFIFKCLKNECFRPIVERWRELRTLIIDEISMLDGRLFDQLEAIGRGFRRSDRPFGGIQLILCGDFCQLPPIGGKNKKGEDVAATFAFDANSWSECVGKPMMLTKVFRQKDQRFVDMLNEMRFGKMSEETVRAFGTLSRKVEYTDGIEPTEIYSTRYEVQRANTSRLNQLTGKAETYTATDMSGRDSEGRLVSDRRRSQLLEKLVCQERVILKVGAQVMLIKNLVQGKLVNGSVGKVIRFSTEKQEGQEVKQDERNNSKADSGPRKPDPPQRTWPVVRFIDGTERLMTPASFEINTPDGDVEARRVQVPLILAWALSVHKSQGQTLERVKVDLRRTFEKGQAYVALSRATSMSHLQILNFSAAKVMTHPRVLEWYGVSNQQDDELDDDMDAEE